MVNSTVVHRTLTCQARKDKATHWRSGGFRATFAAVFAVGTADMLTVALSPNTGPSSARAFIRVLAIAFLLLNVKGARAGHYAGGSITWECIGAGQY